MEPMLRFKADDGSEFPAWEEKTLGEVFTEIKEKNRSELPVLSVQQGAGTVLRDSSERRIAYNKNSLNNYKAMRKGDFIIHLRSFEGGLECSNHDGISSPAYHILRSNMILSDAFKDYFRSYAFIKGKLSDAVVGIRDGKNIDMPTFWEIQMSIPSLPEQRKIADFLSAVDAVIAAQQAEVDAWEQRKKGVMQKLFSQEVRFKADDGSDFPDWEEKTLGDLGEFIKGAPLSKADIAPEGNPMILYGELYTTYGEVAYEIARSTNRNVDDKYRSKIGDVLIPTSGETPEEISTATCVMKEGVILAGDLYIYRTVDEIDGRIMSYLLNHQANKAISCIAQGKSVVHVQAKELRNITVVFPFEMGEQRKIADCLASMDEVIQKSKDELAKWQELKKGLLQQMFV